MKRKKYAVLAAATLVMSMTMGVIQAADSIKVNAYKVSIKNELNVAYENSAKGFFEKGFITGFGSAVTFKGYNTKGEPEFYAITDRGPNGDAPSYQENEKVSPTKFFPSKAFTPSIGILTIKKDGAYVESEIKIKDKTGKNISGLPLAADLVGSTGEQALDMDFNILGYDSEGMDPEGIAIDKDGNLWICDEYGPFLAKLDKDGKILEKYAPGKGLPEVLKYRIANRGFEGLSISSSGKIFVSVQSVLDIEGKTGKTAAFTRIIEFDPETRVTKTYAYPVSKDDYKAQNGCKIGDIYAVDDKTLLVIEQGKFKDKNMHNLIYKVDLSKATDITNVKYEEKELEYVEDTSVLKNVIFSTKEKLVDLREKGWTAEKAEGICLLPDNKTIVVINDNDFGMTVNVEDKMVEKPDILSYIYNASQKAFTYQSDTYKGEGKPVITLAENTEPAEIWTIELPSKLK